jgi:hypothetical protein
VAHRRKFAARIEAEQQASASKLSRCLRPFLGTIVFRGRREISTAELSELRMMIYFFVVG